MLAIMNRYLKFLPVQPSSFPLGSCAQFYVVLFSNKMCSLFFFIVVEATPWAKSEILLVKKHFAMEITTNSQPSKIQIQSFLNNNPEISKNWYLVKCKVHDLAQKLLV